MKYVLIWKLWKQKIIPSDPTLNPTRWILVGLDHFPTFGTLEANTNPTQIFARSEKYFFTKEAAPRGSKLPTAREGEAENYAKLISRNTIENPI